MISETDLIINKDGSIYHLGLLPEQICDNVILVGDPDRINMFEPKLDRVFFKHHVREFHSLMGEVGGKQLLIVSTGIGTDNIDIVFNELDALANVNFITRTVNKKHRKLNFIRMGTSGTIQKEIPVDSFIASSHGIGLDVLMHYYQRESNEDLDAIKLEVDKILKKERLSTKAYVTKADTKLLSKVDKSFLKGMTVTLPGFYGPQGRQVRANTISLNLLDKLATANFGKHKITNLEMETAGIYGMAEVLGHRALSLNAILANRITKEFSNQAEKTVDNLIDKGLELIINL